jgi:alkylation response protein AidB-like acyl-CoA dehydrogenase
MDFKLPEATATTLEHYHRIIEDIVRPGCRQWYRRGALPHAAFVEMGSASGLGLAVSGGRLSAVAFLENALMMEALGRVSPGVAIAILAHVDLGAMALIEFASDDLHARYAKPVMDGTAVMCLGNTEGHAGSDVAAVATRAEKTDGGWLLTGAKPYVTNGDIADLAVVTAVTHPNRSRSKRLSMFLVDLHATGVSRKKLDKQVWIPSDLTRLRFDGVFVPEDHLVGHPGRGLQQALSVFTRSRLPISGLTLGTARGAYELAVSHARKRTAFGRRLIDMEVKGFEMAELYARMEASRLLVWKACWEADTGKSFQLASSAAKFLAVDTAREVARWSADVFGAASVMHQHPIHKYPMDVWGASLGEGTQDVQKLIIYRELLNRWDRDREK